MQLAYKMLLNSSYGAFGSVYYPLYDIDIAESTTIGGKTATKEMVRYVNNYMNKLQETANEEFIVAGDTDSVDCNALIYIDGKKERIEDVYDKINLNCDSVKLLNGTELLFPKNNIKTLSLNGETKIENISRHKVSKGKWKISIDNDEIIFTEDHSVMVYRNGEIIECKPKDILNTDFLLKKK
jgi:DNA polymerase elongation subunit (family B)